MRNIKYLSNFYYYVKSRFDLNSRVCQICLSVTDTCNCRCIQCDTWRIYKDNPELSKKEFNTTELKRVLRISNSLKFLKSVSLSGGEPSMRKDLILIAKTFNQYNNKIRFFFQSNCINYKLIVPKAIKMSQFADTTVCVSIDGIGKVHDRIRGISGAYESTVKTLKMLSSAGVDTSLSFNILPCNCHQLEKVWDEFGKFSNSICARPIAVGAFFKTSKKNIFVLNKEQINKVSQQLQRIDYGNNIFLYQVYLILTKKKRLFPCGAGFFSVVITPTLNVYPCSACPSNWCFGNLRDVDYNLDKLLNSKKGKLIKKKVMNCVKYKEEFCLNEPEFFSTAHFQTFRIFFWLLFKDPKEIFRNLFGFNSKIRNIITR